MSITIGGHTWRTLAQPLYAGGQLVKEVYANGVKVYPDLDFSRCLALKFSGTTVIHNTAAVGQATWGYSSVRLGTTRISYAVYVVFDLLDEKGRKSQYWIDDTRTPVRIGLQAISDRFYVVETGIALMVKGDYNNDFYTCGLMAKSQGMAMFNSIRSGVNLFVQNSEIQRARHASSAGVTYYTGDEFKIPNPYIGVSLSDGAGHGSNLINSIDLLISTYGRASRPITINGGGVLVPINVPITKLLYRSDTDPDPSKKRRVLELSDLPPLPT